MLNDIAVDDGDQQGIDPKPVNRVFKQINVNKTTDLDSISALLLNTCTNKLTPVWCPIFQWSLDSHRVPSKWKMRIITPAPKESCPTENNYFRPIAQTSVVMKFMETVKVSKLQLDVGPHQDPYQFALMMLSTV